MEIIARAPENSIEAYTLFSGSTGNCVYIRCGGTSVLIDAGMCAKSIENAVRGIGHDPSELSAIFVTHEHIDHIRGIDVLSRRYGMPVHTILPCAPYIKCAAGHLFAHPPRYTVTDGNIEISSFTTPHDSYGSVGYVIRTECGCVGVATDLGCMPDSVMERLVECEAVVLESNHDVNMLMNGPYPMQLKQRILSRRGHLSNADCADSVCALARNGVRSIVLAHLSAENNRPEIAYKASSGALESENLNGVKLSVAAVASPTRLI